LSGATENLQTAINSLKTKTDTTNLNLATTKTNANDALQRTTEISFSDDPTPQTNITNKIVLEEVVFTTDLNNITPTTFNYLSGCSSNIQNQINSIVSNNGVPTGTIIQSVVANLQTLYPDTWLYCDGQRVSRSTYSTLFSFIGTTYGMGDMNTNFNLPDLRSCFIRGADSISYNGTTYTPNAVGDIQQDAIQSHVHTSGNSGSYLATGTSVGSGYFPGTVKPNQSSFNNTGSVTSTARTNANETRPLNHALYFYIRT